MGFSCRSFSSSKGCGRETTAATMGESSVQAFQQRASIIDHLVDVDSIPISKYDPKCLSELVILEDNEAVIKMTIKGRSTAMRHVQRTRRVNFDWLYERFLNDKGIRIRYLSTKFQIADMLTKGSCTAQQWNMLLDYSSITQPYKQLVNVNSRSTHAMVSCSGSRFRSGPCTARACL